MADGTDATLTIASGDEVLDGHSLQASIDALESMASGLDADLATAVGVDALQAIGAAQVRLRDRAEALIGAQIAMVAGEVLITAAHVDAATQYAKDTIARMTAWKRKIAIVAKVVDFVGVVMTGDGAKILVAAINLKASLD